MGLPSGDNEGDESHQKDAGDDRNPLEDAIRSLFVAPGPA